MAISFAQGGPAPCIFAEEVFDYLVKVWPQLHGQTG
jgi:hypothetical protein